MKEHTSHLKLPVAELIKITTICHEIWLGLVNICIYYVCQISEIYQCIIALVSGFQSFQGTLKSTE